MYNLQNFNADARYTIITIYLQQKAIQFIIIDNVDFIWKLN